MCIILQGTIYRMQGGRSFLGICPLRQQLRLLDAVCCTVYKTVYNALFIGVLGEDKTCIGIYKKVILKHMRICPFEVIVQLGPD